MKLDTPIDFKYVSSFSANAHQGIASDGTYIYTTDSSNIYKYTKAGSLQTSRNIASDNSATPHGGDLHYDNGFLYVAMNNWPSSPAEGVVLKINASDLSLDSVISTENDHAATTVTQDSDGNFWVVAFDLTANPVKIHKYNSSWVYQGAYELEVVDPAGADWVYDGIAWVDGYLLANIHHNIGIALAGEGYLDRYSFDGTKFTRVQRWPHWLNGKECGQGISLDPSEPGVLWWAVRGDSNKAYKSTYSYQTESPQAGAWVHLVNKTVREGEEGDSITVTFPARKFLKIKMFATATDGALNTDFIINGDTGSNYCRKVMVNYSPITQITNASNFALESGQTNDGQIQINDIEVINIPHEEKIVWYRSLSLNNTGAGTPPTHVESTGKWANANDAVVSITWRNDNPGNFKIGSSIDVWGSDSPVT